jgi:hypothetical protein
MKINPFGFSAFRILFGCLAIAVSSALPWITSDVSVDETSTNIGVLAWQQQFLQEELLLTAGKLFVGNFVLSSDYYAANTTRYLQPQSS